MAGYDLVPVTPERPDVDDAKARAERVLDGSQTGQFTKRMLARDVLAVFSEYERMTENCLTAIVNHTSAEREADRLRAFIEKMLDPAWWREDVDSNGEYMTTRARGYYEVVGDLKAVLNG